MAGHAPNQNFTGRKDALDLIDQHLLPRAIVHPKDASPTRVFAICGMGGVGKTDLAIQYAYSRRHKFGAVFWLEATSMSQLISDFGRISTSLGLEELDEAQDLEFSKEVAKAWLNQPRSYQGKATESPNNDSWLLIFDNVDDLSKIAEYIPANGNGSVLLTSRDPVAKTHFFSNGTGVDLDALPRDDATLLLKRLTKRQAQDSDDDEQDAIGVLADKLDGLPLAMTQMAGFIRRRHLSVREFVDSYNTDSHYMDLHHIDDHVQEQRYSYTLATFYNFKDLSTNAWRLLQTLSFLNPDHIQEKIFLGYKVGGKEHKSKWVQSTFEDAGAELLSTSIIRRNINSNEMWIHRVVQTEVRTRMDVDQSYTVFREALSLISSVWPPGDLCSQASERWVICEDLFPHLDKLYQIYNEYTDRWQSFEVDPTFPLLLNEAAVYLHERGFSYEGKAYLQLALDLCDRANIKQEPLLSDIHLTMGALSNETNDADECFKHNVLCLALRKAEMAKTKQPSLRVAFAHSQMGIAYMMVRKFAQATQYFEQSVEMIKGLDVDVDEFGFPVCNLGLAYWVQQKFDDADTTLTQLLEQREKRHGKLDKVSYKTGRVLQALGNVKSSKAKQLEEQGQQEQADALWDQAFTLHMQCLEQYEATLGKFNHRTADACHKLAEHHIRRKEDSVAQDYLDRATSIWGERQWFRNESARSSFLRGIHLKSMGGEDNVREGQKWVDRALSIRKQILPDESPKDLGTEDFDNLVCFWSI